MSGVHTDPKCILEIKKYETHRTVLVAWKDRVNVQRRNRGGVALLVFEVYADTAGKEGGDKGLCSLCDYVAVEILSMDAVRQTT